MMKKQFTKNRILFLILLLIALVGIVFGIKRLGTSSISLTKPSEESFQAPGKSWKSPKKVEDYFVERLRMTPEQAKEVRSSSQGNDGKISLRLTQGTTLPALLSNLEYYGFVRDEKALRYALEKTVDTVPGHQEALRVGGNTIDLWASYRISENMTAWEIADELLNHPNYFAFDEYHYLFMP